MNTVAVIALIAIGSFVLVMIPTIITQVAKTLSAHPQKINVNFSIICVYLAVLVVLSLACVFLPKSGLVKSSSPSWEKHYSEIMSQFGRKASKGDFSAPKGYIKTELSFAKRGKKINVITDNYGANILPVTMGTDTPDTGDGKIHVYCYTAYHAVNGYDLSVQNQTPKIEFGKNHTEEDATGFDTIIIKSKKQKSLYLCQFYDHRSASQFFKDGNTFYWPGFNLKNDMIVVVLPKGVEIHECGTS